MNEVFKEELIEQLGWTLLHFVWQGLAIAIVFAILLQALRKASSNCRYLAACVALVMMVAAPIGTYICLEKSNPQAPRTELRAPIEATTLPAVPKTEPVQVIKVVTETKKPLETKPSIIERLNEFLPLLVSAWAIGVGILSLRLTAGWLRVSRLKHLGIEAVERVWHERMSELVRRLRIKQSVRLVQSVAVEVPTVIGWLRPIILMPAGCLASLSPAQVEYILAHELAHVRRNDYLVNLLQCLAETILFYHPAVWWISKRIREEREHCCDDVAVSVCGDRLEYARTLAALEELRGSQNQLVMAAAGAPLLQRIRRLVGQSERNSSHLVWPLAAIIILAVLATSGIGIRSSRAVADDTQGPILRTNHQAITIVKGDSQAQAEAFARQGSSANQTAPQINIKVKFFELDERDFPKSIFNLPGASNAVSTSIKLAIPKHSPKVMANIATVLANVTNSVVQSFAGKLSEPDFEKALEALKAARSAEITTPASVITGFGSEAQIFVGEEIPVLTNNSPTATATLMPFGVMLDVTPSLTTNGTRVQLTTLATVAKRIAASTKKTPPVEVAQLSMDATLEERQTLIMGGFMPEVVTKMKDKVPVLGDIPLAGGLFRSENVSKSRKYLIVFVTPTLINWDGSLFHSDQTRTNQKQATQASILHKFRSIRIPEVAFNEVLLEDALEDLNRKISALGLQNTGLKLVFQTNQPATGVPLDPLTAQALYDNLQTRSLAGTSNGVDSTKWRDAVFTPARSFRIEPVKITVAPALKDATVGEILETIAKTVHASVGYRVEEDQVKISFTKKSENLGQQTVTGQDRSIHEVLKKTNPVPVSSKLNTIIIPSVHFDKQPLHQVLENLTSLSKLHDPAGIGMPLFVNVDPATGLPYVRDVLVHVALTNAPLANVLEAIIQGSEKPLKYEIEDYGIVFDLKDQMRERMYTRIIPLDVQKFEAEIKAKLGLTFDEAIRKYYEDEFKNTGRPHSGSFNSYWVIDPLVRNYFIREGLDFDPSKPANMGKSLFFNDRKRILMVHSNMKDLELVEKIVEKFKAPPAETEKQPPAVSNSTVITNRVTIRNGREEILSKLDRLRIDSVHYDGLTLVEVIKDLSKISRTHDPDKQGINFFINRAALVTAAAAPVPGAVDPTAGLPNYVEKENGDPAAIVLKMPPAITNVSLTAVLDCIATNNSLQYTIEDYAVVFSFKRSEPPPLFWKTYKLDLEAFNRKLHLFSPEYSGTNASTLTIFLRNLFQTNGIDFSPTNPANAGKSLGFNSRGLLAVHTTRQELNLIEKLLAKINSPPQIHIKVSVAEIDEAAGKILQLDDLMKAAGAKTNFNEPNLTVALPELRVRIPELTAQKNSESSAPLLITNSLASQFTGVLTPQFSKEVLTRLEKADGVRFSPLRDVTTENNCQAQVMAVDIQTIVTGLTTVWTNGTSTNIYSTQNLPLGPVLDLIPKLSEENSTIEMNIIASVTEFLGYDAPASKNRTDATIPLPKIKLRQFKSSVDVSDGETIVLMGKEKANAAPQAKSKPPSSKQLIIFITPTLINPNGSTYNKVQKL